MIRCWNCEELVKTTVVDCSHCDGEGTEWDEDHETDCVVCEGWGEVECCNGCGAEQ